MGIRDEWVEMKEQRDGADAVNVRRNVKQKV